MDLKKRLQVIRTVSRAKINELIRKIEDNLTKEEIDLDNLELDLEELSYRQDGLISQNEEIEAEISDVEELTTELETVGEIEEWIFRVMYKSKKRINSFKTRSSSVKGHPSKYDKSASKEKTTDTEKKPQKVADDGKEVHEPTADVFIEHKRSPKDEKRPEIWHDEEKVKEKKLEDFALHEEIENMKTVKIYERKKQDEYEKGQSLSDEKKREGEKDEEECSVEEKSEERLEDDFRKKQNGRKSEKKEVNEDRNEEETRKERRRRAGGHNKLKRKMEQKTDIICKVRGREDNRHPSKKRKKHKQKKRRFDEVPPAPSEFLRDERRDASRKSVEDASRKSFDNMKVQKRTRKFKRKKRRPERVKIGRKFIKWKEEIDH